MPLRSLVVFVDGSLHTALRTRYAIALAEQHSAHLIGIFRLAPAWSKSGRAQAYTIGPAAVREMVEQHTAQEQKECDAAKRLFVDLVLQTDLSHEFRLIREIDPLQAASRHLLHSDLVVVGTSQPDGPHPMASAETLLMSTGVPVLILPDAWRGKAPVAQNILLAWNASREARRAVIDSLALLRAAHTVTVVVVDPLENESYGEQPGADIAQYLCRHGANVRVEQHQSGGRAVADVLRDVANRNACDLMVIGAYSHARMREMIFGGVTRSLLAEVAVPTLIAH